RLMNERGIEREEVGTNEYEDTNELKEKTEELRKLEIKVENELKKLDALADEQTSAISSEVKLIIALGEGNKHIPKVELKKTMFGDYSIDTEQIDSLKEYTNRLKHENSDLRHEFEEGKEKYMRMKKSYLNDSNMIDKQVEDKIYTQRRKLARERFNYDNA